MNTTLFNNKYRIKSARLKEWNYASEGLYFITVCTFEQMCLFGNILNGKMILNDLGKIVRNEWEKTPEIRKNVDLDLFVIMPNHFHGVIRINNDRNRDGNRRDTARRVSTGTSRQFAKSVSGSVPTIIRAFKSAVTKNINQHRNTPTGFVWQHNYYDHIILDDNDLYRIREYIQNNPAQWEFDRNNPECRKRYTVHGKRNTGV